MTLRRPYLTATLALVLLAGCSADSAGGPATIPIDDTTTPAAVGSPTTEQATVLDGSWHASIEEAAARQTLEDSGFGAIADQILVPQHLAGTEHELRFVDGDFALVNLLEGQVWDDGTYTVDADLLTMRSAGVIEYQFQISGPTLTLTMVSDSAPDFSPGIPDEAIQRMLYTTSAWTRQD